MTTGVGMQSFTWLPRARRRASCNNEVVVFKLIFKIVLALYSAFPCLAFHCLCDLDDAGGAKLNAGVVPSWAGAGQQAVGSASRACCSLGRLEAPSPSPGHVSSQAYGDDILGLLRQWPS